jgi:hypothetical protein
MHKTMLKQGNAALIAGILVVLVVAGLFKLLWMTIHAPIVWIALLAWIILPVIPFVIRFFTTRQSSTHRRMGRVC